MLPFELTKDTPYLALSGELWSVFYEYFTEIDRVIKGFYCILKHMFLDGNDWISINMSMKFIPMGPVDNNQYWFV